jgi:uncharacterized protein YegJ (DUF2314 family)
LAGLPVGYSFFLTTVLRDKAGREEQMFVGVRSIKRGVVSGVLANDPAWVSGYKNGDPYTFPEKEMLDWTITRPDGTEEGNVVGNFLETYHKQRPK